MKVVAAGIQKLPLASLLALEKGETVQVEGEGIQLSDVEIRRTSKGDNPHLVTDQLISIEVDPTVTPEQIRQGLSREITRKIQVARKTADFNLDDKVNLQLSCQGALKEAAETHLAKICSDTLATKFTFTDKPQGFYVENVDIDGEMLGIGLTVIPR